MKRVVACLIAVVAAVGTFAAVAGASSGVTNGGLEAGNFNGWTVDDSGSGDWFVYNGPFSPLSSKALAKPPEGTYAAVTDQDFPSEDIVYQNIAVPTKKATLSFYVYYHTYAAFASPPTLDYTTVAPNQQYRIDVMDPGSPDDSVLPGDVLLNLFQTEPGDPQALAPTCMSFDLSAFAGQTVRLRFAESDNQDVLNASFDDVQLGTGCASSSGKGKKVASIPQVDHVFLCYSKFQSDPGVWTSAEATALEQQGYWLPYALAGNVDGATNVGAFHLDCNLTGNEKATGGFVDDGGGTWSADYAAVAGLYPAAG